MQNSIRFEINFPSEMARPPLKSLHQSVGWSVEYSIPTKSRLYFNFRTRHDALRIHQQHLRAGPHARVPAGTYIIHLMAPGCCCCVNIARVRGGSSHCVPNVKMRTKWEKYSAAALGEGWSWRVGGLIKVKVYLCRSRGNTKLN